MKNKLSRLSVTLLIVLVVFAAGVLVVNPFNLAASASHSLGFLTHPSGSGAAGTGANSNSSSSGISSPPESSGEHHHHQETGGDSAIDTSLGGLAEIRVIPSLRI